MQLRRVWSAIVGVFAGEPRLTVTMEYRRVAPSAERNKLPISETLERFSPWKDSVCADNCISHDDMLTDASTATAGRI